MRKVNIVGTSLERDIHSKSLTETNHKKAEEYLEKRKILQERENKNNHKINTLQDQIDKLQADIKEMLATMKKKE